MATLLSKDQVKLSELNSDFFLIKFLFLILRFWKRIALVYFLQTGWSYTFLKANNLNQDFYLKKSFEMLKICTLWCILPMFPDILESTVENKKNV